MKSGKFTLKLVRSFGIGFEVFDPSLNGFYVQLHLVCFIVVVWNRGKRLFAFENYWRRFDANCSSNA